MGVLYTALVGLLMVIGVVHAQQDLDTYGTYFRIVFIDNFVDYPIYRPVDLYVCNRGTRSNLVNVTIPHLDHPDCPKSKVERLPARRCFRFVLCSEIRHTFADGSLAKKVVEVHAARDVSVQGFNVEKFSADSYAILPWHLNGHQYYVMAYALQSIQTQFAITTREITKVRIVIPDRTDETITVDYNGLRYSNGESVTFELKPETTFLAQSAGDLTGVMIQSSRKIAVFTGNVRTFNDFNMTSRDHLVEQVPPVGRWGKEFIYVPTPRQISGDVIKMIAYQTRTTVRLIDIDGERQMQAGMEPTEFKLERVTHIRADTSLLVAVFVRSQDGKDAGFIDPADPSMYFLPAVDQYHNEYYLPRFIDANGTDYRKVWVLLAIPEAYIRDVQLDNNPVGDVSFLTRIQDNRALPYWAGALQVSSNSMHRLTLIRARFMAVAYGASDRESFGSTLGYRFLNTGCEETDMVIADNIDNDCDGIADEETCGDGIDNDNDGLMDEDCKDEFRAVGTGDATGTSFAIVFMTNLVLDTNVQIDQIELYIAPLERDTVISITAPAYNGPNKPFLPNLKGSVNSVMQIPLHPNMRVTPANSRQIGASTKTTKVIKVTSNKNIVVYGINKKQYSTDGFLALPDTVLGNEYYAYCNSPIIASDDRCQFVAAAIEDNTDIYIDVASGVVLDGIDGGPDIIGPDTIPVRLASYEAIEIQSIHDLTGTRVYTRDDKHFSFFSGNIRTKLPLSRGSRDHLVEQLLPTNMWGTSYVAMPTPRDLDEGDVFKVVANEPNTRVDYWYFDNSRFTRRGFFVLQPGGHRDIMTNNSSPISIKTNKPIQVVQISKSAPPGNRMNDPSAIVLIPEDRWGNNYRFVTPLSGQRDANGNQLSFDNYLIIAVHKRYRDGMLFQRFDGREIRLGNLPGWEEMPGEQDDIEGLVYRLPPGQGQSAIENPRYTNATWLALVFGRANRETYGNAIGLKFHGHDPANCVSMPMTPGDGIDNDCDGRIDEEMKNNIDDDKDGRIDEDLALQPTGYRYIFVFEENFVEYPRNYALEIYVGRMTNDKILCRMETPVMDSTPTYDTTVVVHDPTMGSLSDRIQFAVPSTLRAQGTGVHRNSVVMTCDSPVTVMGINKETFSVDAFIAFEERALGDEYYTMSFGPATLRTQFAVVATQDGITSVDMRFKAPVMWNSNIVNFLDVRLSRFEVFLAQSEGDLTGSRIRANNKIAVFSGNVRTKVELSGSRDHLVSQLPPTSSWGTSFHIVPTFFRTVGDLVRVIARQNNTILRWDGQSSQIDNAGDFVELDVSTRAFRLQSTGPVMVMQILKSQAMAYHTEPADPCFFLVMPIRHYTNITTLVTPLYSRGFYKDGQHYRNRLTIIVMESDSNGLRINGMSINDNPVLGFASSILRRNIAGSNYIALDLEIEQMGLGTYTITHRDRNVRFSGYLVGVADRESYCVPIGSTQF